MSLCAFQASEASPCLPKRPRNHGAKSPSRRRLSSSTSRACHVATVTKKTRNYETNNPNEKWLVYYDDYYQREYYHELNSNRTQWQPPGVCDCDDEISLSSCCSSSYDQSSISTSSRSTPLLVSRTSMEVMPMPTEIHMTTVNGSFHGISPSRSTVSRRHKRRIAFAIAVLALATTMIMKASVFPSANIITAGEVQGEEVQDVVSSLAAVSSLDRLEPYSCTTAGGEAGCQGRTLRSGGRVSVISNYLTEDMPLVVRLGTPQPQHRPAS